MIEKGGLKVVSTLDYALQEKGEIIVKEGALENEIVHPSSPAAAKHAMALHTQLYGDKSADATGGWSDAALDNAALQYATTGAMPAMGMGKDAVKASCSR